MYNNLFSYFCPSMKQYGSTLTSHSCHTCVLTCFFNYCSVVVMFSDVSKCFGEYNVIIMIRNDAPNLKHKTLDQNFKHLQSDSIKKYEIIHSIIIVTLCKMLP